MRDERVTVPGTVLFVTAKAGQGAILDASGQMGQTGIEKGAMVGLFSLKKIDPAQVGQMSELRPWKVSHGGTEYASEHSIGLQHKSLLVRSYW